MKQKILKIWPCIHSKITQSDLYSKTFNFTFDGKEKFQTFFGGVVSIIIRVFIIAIAISLSVTIVQRSNSTFSVTTFQRDLTNDKEKHYFAKNDIFFNLKMYGPNPEVLLDPTYFNLKISQVNYLRDTNNNGSSAKYKSIPYEYCGDNLPEVQKNIKSLTDYAKYICPKNRDFYIRSNYNSDSYEIIQIDINKWSGDFWKSDNEIFEALSLHYIDLGLVSNYFDFNDYTSPIHSYLHDLSYF